MMCAVQGLRRAGRACACASCACPTRRPRTSTNARPTSSCAPACAPTSRSPASRPTCTSGSRRRACWRCASRCAGARRTARRRGSATAPMLKAFDVFRRIEAMDFARESSELFDRPSINLGRIEGGDVFNKVPDRCEMVVDVRYLPGQDPGAILAQIRALPDVTVAKTLMRAPAYVERTNPYVRALRDAVGAHDRGRGAERRARRRLRRDLVPRGGHTGGRVRARPAAATTAPRSGSRSPRCGATARRSRRSCARCRSGSRASARAARRPDARSTGGWRDAGLPRVPRAAAACGCRFAARRARDRRAERRRRRRPSASTRCRAFVDDLKQGGTIKGAGGGHHARAGGRSADDPADRLRPPLRRRRRDARSDTMILVRLDPDANATTVLSIPRDLKVDFTVPGGGCASARRSTRPTPTAARC